MFEFGLVFFFSSRRRHTRFDCDWSSDVCSSDLDDYVTKPFSLRELLARVRAVLRRPGPRRKFEEFAFGDARVHLRSRRAFRGGVEVRLTRKEFDLLVYLVEHRGAVVMRERLLDDEWGYERFPTT